MKITLIFLLSIIISLFNLHSTYYDSKGLVFNGEVYKHDEYPFVVFIQVLYPELKSYSMCTGSLLTKYFVLTAAHCCYGQDFTSIRVFPGSEIGNENKFENVSEMYVHRNYTPKKSPIISDVCILKIKKPFPNVTRFIEIGGTSKEFADLKPISCTNIGFGIVNDKNDSGALGYKMTINVRHGRYACEDSNSKRIKDGWPQFLCSEPNSAQANCAGDSGGPMICKGKLYGICSFGYSFNDKINEGCGHKDNQEVHVFLKFFRKWINSILTGKYDENVDYEKDNKIGEDDSEDDDEGGKGSKKKKKKKKKKKNSGNLLESLLILNTTLALLLFYVYTFILNV